ncbi:MAG: putative metal-binding motif-containing protein, partial [Myxococcota bacterium]
MRTPALLAMLAACTPLPDRTSCPDADKVAAFADNDGDGFGRSSVGLVCRIEAGLSANDQDCNDTQPSVFPGGVEVCDGLDNNCDGAVDEGFPVSTWYADTDEDGFGVVDQTFASCQDPGAGWSLDPGDCDDEDAKVNPAAAEDCSNGIDDDCDTVIDDATEVCDDGIDNDCDDLPDCDDPDCFDSGRCLPECVDEGLPGVPFTETGSTVSASDDWTTTDVTCGAVASPDVTFQFEVPSE